MDRFASEESCREYLIRLRWPGGFVCPRCQGQRAWETGRVGLFECSDCGHQTTVTAGTIFQDTHKPLRAWFHAIWLVTTQKQGASAMTVQQVLGLGSYRTAWAWLHKLRHAMVRPDRDLLEGTVEVDEAWVGGVEPGVFGRQSTTKAQVVIAVEERGRRMGRVRMKRVDDASAGSLEGFVKSVVTPGSVIHTDGYSGYMNLGMAGYQHRPRILAGRGRTAATEELPRVHLVVSLLKRWLLGTHQGAPSLDHLDYYLDEFTFRFNRRRSRHRGLLFRRLLENAVRVDPLPYEQIVGRTGKPRLRRRARIAWVAGP
jgi:transposase-like protein/Zn ribbon nucleic-acid-binding protein